MSIQKFDDKIQLDKEHIQIIIELLTPFFQELSKIEYIDTFGNLYNLINHLYIIIESTKIEKENYKIIILLKFCYYLIKYSEEKEEYIKNKEIQTQFEQIKDDIKNILSRYNNLDKIQEIIIKIVSELIKLKIFKNYKFVINIIEIFVIYNYKFDNLFKIIESEFIEEYFIKFEKDVLIKNINFYYIYLKYIRKNNNINDIPYLSKTKSVFLDLLNKKESKIIFSDIKIHYIII